MENYTKYTLKSEAALSRLLLELEDILLVSCNKCFKESTGETEPELQTVADMAAEMGKTVTGKLALDFVCNAHHTEKALAIPEGTKCVLVIACGLGVQTVAAMTNLPVYAACDSIGPAGLHGMALTTKTCGACAQCYLTATGGICPIVDCAKGLVNGQCGGAKNGKCEADPSKDCAWEKIQQRLAAQGRAGEMTGQSVQLRDWAKAGHAAVARHVAAIRDSRLDGYYGGIHPAENKERTEHLPLRPFPDPDTVAINLSQHAGAPANCIVKVGDHVDVGQKVGEAAAFISANVHASVSGTVIAIEDRPHATRGVPTACVVIENDKKYTLHESVRPRGELKDLSPADIVAIVKEAGIIGMGGAGFPMYVKLMPKNPIDTVLLNGCECEPMLTADHRVLLEQAEQVIFGLQAICKAVGAGKGIIAVEDNKADAIEKLQEMVAELPNIEVCSVRTKYPQGAEKMLIKRVLGRQVPGGGLPADVGCVVANVSTAKAIADAVRLGLPLVERVVTVTGDRVRNPGNFLVRIGTGTKALLEHCGGIEGDEPAIVKIGGPMMGAVQPDADVPITKCSNGITVFSADPTAETACIRCGRCVDVCPMELKPLNLARYAKGENWAACRDEGVMNCLECRCCEHICAAKIPLVARFRAAKAAVRGLK